MQNYLWLSFFILFAAEALTFAAIVSKLGFITALLLFGLAGMVGLWIVREKGASTLFRVMQKGGLNAEDIKNGGFLLLAGLLFLFPGFLSDIAGFLLLIPSVRNALLTQIASRFPQKPSASPAYQDGVIEGEFVVVEDDTQQISRKPEQLY